MNMFQSVLKIGNKKRYLVVGEDQLYFYHTPCSSMDQE